MARRVNHCKGLKFNINNCDFAIRDAKQSSNGVKRKEAEVANE